MKYPIDSQTTEAFLGQLVAHDRAQRQMVQALTLILQEAMEDCEMTFDGEDAGPDWYLEGSKLVNIQKQLKVYHENRIFNEKNGVVEPPSSMTIAHFAETVRASCSEIAP